MKTSNKTKLVVTALALIFSLMPATASTALKEKTPYIQADCSIFDYQGTLVRKLKYWQCIFLKDGGLIASGYFSAEDKENYPLSFFSPEGNLLWGKQWIANNKINLCRNDQAFSIVTTEDKVVAGQLSRGDGVAILDFQGNSLAKWSLLEHYDELNSKMNLERTSAGADPKGLELLRSKADGEFTNLAGAFEIPPNPLAKTIPAFQAGNFLLPFYNQHLLILSSDLKEVQWISKKTYYTREAKVLKNGHILLSQDNRGPQGAAVLELDPNTESVVWKFTGTPKLSIPNFGSVSELNGKFALTGNPDVAHISVINRKGKLLSTFKGNPHIGGFSRVQFLKHNGFLKSEIKE